VSELDALSAELRLYDRLFMDSSPDSGGKDFLSALNPESLKVVHAKLEPSLKKAVAAERFQFERIGYFIADAIDHKSEEPVFNRITGLKDSWGTRAE
jgi:glutaminyl-tRNA synthetase